MRGLLAASLFTVTSAFAQELPRSTALSTETDAVLHHVQSGMGFPADVGPFHRTKATHFNASGSDVGVDYRLTGADGKIYASVYIYPAATRWRPSEDEDHVYDALEKEMICKQELEFRKSELLQFHSESALGPVKTVDIEQNGSTQQGSRLKFAAMSKPGGAANVMKEEFDLFCFATELWTISYRFTYADYNGADADIAQFMRDLTWPQ